MLFRTNRVKIWKVYRLRREVHLKLIGNVVIIFSKFIYHKKILFTKQTALKLARTDNHLPIIISLNKIYLFPILADDGFHDVLFSLIVSETVGIMLIIYFFKTGILLGFTKLFLKLIRAKSVKSHTFLVAFKIVIIEEILLRTLLNQFLRRIPIKLQSIFGIKKNFRFLQKKSFLLFTSKLSEFLMILIFIDILLTSFNQTEYVSNEIILRLQNILEKFTYPRVLVICVKKPYICVYVAYLPVYFLEILFPRSNLGFSTAIELCIKNLFLIIIFPLFQLTVKIYLNGKIALSVAKYPVHFFFIGLLDRPISLSRYFLSSQNYDIIISGSTRSLLQIAKNSLSLNTSCVIWVIIKTNTQLPLQSSCLLLLITSCIIIFLLTLFINISFKYEFAFSIIKNSLRLFLMETKDTLNITCDYWWNLELFDIINNQTSNFMIQRSLSSNFLEIFRGTVYLIYTVNRLFTRGCGTSHCSLYQSETIYFLSYQHQKLKQVIFCNYTTACNLVQTVTLTLARILVESIPISFMQLYRNSIHYSIRISLTVDTQCRFVIPLILYGGSILIVTVLPVQQQKIRSINILKNLKNNIVPKNSYINGLVKIIRYRLRFRARQCMSYFLNNYNVIQHWSNKRIFYSFSPTCAFQSRIYCSLCPVNWYHFSGDLPRTFNNNICDKLNTNSWFLLMVKNFLGCGGHLSLMCHG